MNDQAIDKPSLSESADHGMLLADQVEKHLLSDIERMKQQGQVRLPHQTNLAETFDVSLRTVRTVVNRLKKRGIIRSVKGKGMFILENAETGTGGNVLIVAERFSGTFVGMFAGIASEQLLKRGYTPVMTAGRDLESRAADAVGMVILEAGDQARSFLENTRLPYCGIGDVFSENHLQSVKFQSVRSNGYLASYFATEILLRSGKDTVVLFCNKLGKRLLLGYQEALEDHGLEPDDDQIVLVGEMHSETEIQAHRARLLDMIVQSKTEGKSVGFVDFSGAVTVPQSDIYHGIMENVFSPKDTVAFGSHELERTYMADTLVERHMTPVVGRALDIVLGKVTPTGICENVDALRVSVKTKDRWTHHTCQEYVASLREKKPRDKAFRT